MKIRLHTQAQNSAGERVRIALNLKSVVFEYVSIASTKSTEYLIRNPQGLMPTLEVDGVNVTQSLAAVELIEELFPEPTLYPSDVFLRAQARGFAMSICAELHALTVRRVRKHLSEELHLSDENVGHWYSNWTQKTLGALEETLARRIHSTRFCFADYPTVADIALVPQIANARRFDFDLSQFPLITEIEARCAALPAFFRARPVNQIDFERIHNSR